MKGFEQIGALKAKAEGFLPFINQEIEKIIKNKVKDQKVIEELLDILLNYQYLGVGEEEFKKLNEYYRQIDKEAANNYDQFFEEI